MNIIKYFCCCRKTQINMSVNAESKYPLESNVADDYNESNHTSLSDINIMNTNEHTHENTIDFTNYKLNVKTRIHDIKTPLNNIVLAVNAEDNISEMNKLNIIENAYMIKELLDDLLKNESNLTDFKFSKKKVNVKRLLHKIEQLMKNEFILNKKTFIITKRDIDCDYFYGDERLLLRLFSNLIKNSLKYKKELFTPITLIIENIFKNQTLITNIVVCDNNEQLPKNIQDRLFQPFNTTCDSGLGLYICKKIVDLHNGTIEYSHFNDQNIFLVTFKSQMFTQIFHDSDSSSDTSNTDTKIQELVNKSQFDIRYKYKILVIDDCLVTLKLMKYLINKIDKEKLYEINTLNVLSNDLYSDNNIEKLLSYNIILTDYHIGSTTCDEFIQVLKNHHFKGQIYCITGNEDPYIVNHIMELGTDKVFFKPIQVQVLTNVLGYM